MKIMQTRPRNLTRRVDLHRNVGALGVSGVRGSSGCQWCERSEV